MESPFVFHQLSRGKLTIFVENYKKKKRRLQEFSIEILRKCAGGSLVSARLLCLVNDASNRVLESTT